MKFQLESSRILFFERIFSPKIVSAFSNFLLNLFSSNFYFRSSVSVSNLVRTVSAVYKQWLAVEGGGAASHAMVDKVSEK